MEYEQLAISFAEYLKENDGQNVLVYDVESKTKTTKRIVFCEKNIEHDAKILAKNFVEYFSKIKKPNHIDGIFKGEWIVLDYNEIIVHIINKKTKQKFNLDKLYASCNQVYKN